MKKHMKKLVLLLAVISMLAGLLIGCGNDSESTSDKKTFIVGFDAEFPQKERLYDTPMQRRFKEVCAMQRDYVG